MKLRRRLRFVLVLAALIVAGAALAGYVLLGRPPRGTNRESRSAVTPATTTARVTDVPGIGSITIPPSALNTPTSPTIAQATAAEEARVPALPLARPVGPLVKIDLGTREPLPSMATLVLTYDPARLPAGVSPDDIFVGYFDETSRTWVTLTGTVDQDRHQISVSTNHASFWEAFTWWRDSVESALFAVTNLDVLQYWHALHLYSDCNGSGGKAVIIDDSQAMDLATACIERDDLTNARLRIVGRRILYLTLVPEPHGVTSTDFLRSQTLSPVDTYSFGADFNAVKTRDDNFTVVLRFDEYGVANQVLDIELKVIPFADQIPKTGRTELIQCLLGVEGISETLLHAQQGDRQGVFESMIGLMTNPKNLDCIVSKLQKIGISIGQEGLTKITSKQVEQLFKTVAKIRLLALGIEATELATHLRGAQGKIVFYSNKPFPISPGIKPAPTGTSVSGPIVMSASGSVRVTIKSTSNACGGSLSMDAPQQQLLWPSYNGHEGESKILGPYNAGAKLTFSITPGSFCHGTFSSANPNHARVTKTGADAWTIEWEDEEQGDADFNDLIMTLERIPDAGAPSLTPTPPSPPVR